MNELSDITALCGDGSAAGGLVTIEYVELDRVYVAGFERVVDANFLEKKVVVLNTGEWLSMPVAVKGKLFNEDQKDTDQGITFPQRIEAELPFHTPAIAGQLDMMARHRFLVKITDRQGQKWIAGTPDEPFSFSSNLNSGDAANASKKHRISFSGQSLTKAPGYLALP
jgi:hypothetical protein